ncbi:MAG: GTP cyclohydrolase I FolE [Promethearchaeia archaeon]
MLDKTKTNSKLGKEVNDYLVKKGVQTPMINLNKLTEEEKIEKIQNYFKEIMNTMGLDLNDDSLMETPKRFAKMYIKELFWGLDYRNFPKCTVVENKIKYDEMVFERNITSMSACEHHFVTINGLAHIAYIPNKKVLGLSKLNRITEYFSRRPQIQERLTEQIFYALEYILETSDIAVIIDGEHYCVKSRGVEDYNSSTITSKIGGKFKEFPSLKSEFLSLLNNKK